MKYKFFLVSAEDAEEDTKLGLAWATTDENKAKWIENNDVANYLSTGYVHGQDYIVKDNVPYFMGRSYINIDEGYVLFICEEARGRVDRFKFN